MREQSVLLSGRVRYRVSIEPLSFVLDRNRDLSVRSAAARDVYGLAWILLVAVDDGICERFTQRHFNVQFTPVTISEPRDEAHELVDEWRDDRDLARERLPHLNERNRTKSLHPGRKSLCVCHCPRTPIGICVPVTTRQGTARAKSSVLVSD
jgi:hypothetical protein